MSRVSETAKTLLIKRGVGAEKRTAHFDNDANFLDGGESELIDVAQVQGTDSDLSIGEEWIEYRAFEDPETGEILYDRKVKSHRRN